MQSEKQDDEAVYAKLQCWCKKNKQEQSAIREQAIADFDSAVAAAKEAFAEMQTLQAKRNKEFADRGVKAKAEATFRGECTKEAKEFNSRDLELRETAKAAKTAVTILKGGQSLLQTRGTELESAMKTLLNTQVSAEGIASQTTAMLSLQAYFDNKKRPSFLQQPVGYESHASQSDGVVGMLEQMIVDLDNQITSGLRAETDRKATCKAKLAALNKEIVALGEAIDTKDKRIGELAADNADSKAAADEAKTARLNAQEFLVKLDAQCQEADEQYTSRTASRNLEMKACSETIKILDNDEAFHALQKTTAFVQVRQDETKRTGGQLAIWAMDSAAKKSARVYLLQTMIRSAEAQGMTTSVFDGVMKAISDLIAALKEEQATETVDRDTCIETQNSLKRDVEDAKFHAETAAEASAELATKIALLTSEINEKSAAIAELDSQIAEATSIRDVGAKDYAVAHSDHLTTQTILQKAIERMSQVYKSLLQGPGADVVEFGATSDTPGSAPAQFTNSGATAQNTGGNKVITLLTDILNESEDAMAKDEQAETDAIAQYGEFMRVSNNDKKAASETIAAKSERKLNAANAKADADSDSASLQGKIASLVEETLKTQEGCAFLLNNYTSRQQKRTEEIESLSMAKQYLQGMN